MKQTHIPIISPSYLNDIECPKRFYNLRILEQWPESSIPRQAQFAVAFHRTMRQLYSPDNRRGESISLESLQQITRQAFRHSRYENNIEQEEDIARCSCMARQYVLSDAPEDIEGTIRVEWKGSTLISTPNGTRVELTAKLDRVIVRRNDDPNTLRILDYKTGKPVVDYMEAFIACWVAKRSFPQYNSFVYMYDWIDDEGRATRDEIHSSKLKGYHKLLLSKIEWLLSDESFPAVEGECCIFCPLRSSCRSTPVVEYRDTEDVFADE